MSAKTVRPIFLSLSLLPMQNVIAKTIIVVTFTTESLYSCLFFDPLYTFLQTVTTYPTIAQEIWWKNVLLGRKSFCNSNQIKSAVYKVSGFCWYTKCGTRSTRTVFKGQSTVLVNLNKYVFFSISTRMAVWR